MDMNPIAIGHQIRKSRENCGLTQSELATRIGKTLRTVQKYESGEIDISISMLYHIAYQLNVTVATLLDIEIKPVLRTVSDLLAFAAEMMDKEDLDIRIENKHPFSDGKLECSIVFNGDNPSSPLTASLCHSLDSIRKEREAFEMYAEDYATYRQRIDNMLVLRDMELTNKQYEALTLEETKKRWQEIMDVYYDARTNGLDHRSAIKDMTRSARAHKSNPGRKEE